MRTREERVYIHVYVLKVQTIEEKNSGKGYKKKSAGGWVGGYTNKKKENGRKARKRKKKKEREGVNLKDSKKGAISKSGTPPFSQMDDWKQDHPVCVCKRMMFITT